MLIKAAVRQQICYAQACDEPGAADWMGGLAGMPRRQTPRNRDLAHNFCVIRITITRRYAPAGAAAKVGDDLHKYFNDRAVIRSLSERDIEFVRMKNIAASRSVPDGPETGKQN